MFSDCKSIENLDLDILNTSSVTNMNEMFNGCSKLKRLEISSFDTFQVETMYHLFYGCNSLESADVSNFILYKLKTNIRDIFGDLEQNEFLKQMYNTLKKIKDEEGIIKDIDSNVVMEITIFPKKESSTLILGLNFKIEQL